MFINLKENIKELAFSAVKMAEDTLSTSDGKEKKVAAIEYVISMLPIPAIIKYPTSLLLSKFIDEAVENAVTYMKNIQNPEE